MKTKFILLTFLTITMTSFEIKPKRIDAAETLASAIVDALQNTSVQAYRALLPAVEEFHQVMEENAMTYNGHIAEAKTEFEIDYINKVFPELNRSFTSVISEGKRAGIQWSKISLVAVEAGEDRQASFSAVPMTIVLSSNGKEFRVQLEKVLILNGKWKVSQYIKLIV